MARRKLEDKLIDKSLIQEEMRLIKGSDIYKSWILVL